eukprot:CAMPEP_0119201832 /NCGR_PEP_ID=MMETSP1316-20130426/30271_1 /TAXON_ID=41880 /ORGANISM="Pycnococcus provasolii, Strain RCC2336" /LENGTH=76 /DNA_ID=CAMNT_0007197987 /DNA_START=275 /DNA_END=505 /DNA_ORIENTATION=+
MVAVVKPVGLERRHERKVVQKVAKRNVVREHGKRRHVNAHQRPPLLKTRLEVHERAQGDDDHGVRERGDAVRELDA